MSSDRFGNLIDPDVGYARGTILSSPVEEVRRRSNALAALRAHIAAHGRSGVFNFTGHRREFLADERDIAQGLAEEWSGVARLAEPLLEQTRQHFAAPQGAEVALFNRGAAGIVALILAIATKGRVVSVAPQGGTHTSVFYGARLAAAQLDQLSPEDVPDSAFREAALAVVTRVTSELDVMGADATRRVVEAARAEGCPVLLDDAYGARVGPVLLEQPATLEFDADVGITSCDKAGLAGPRAGLMAGDPDLVTRALATASAFGLEARGPIHLGVLRALEAFAPDGLRADATVGSQMTTGLAVRLSERRVRRTVMGPSVSEEDVLSILRERSAVDPRLVPVEVTALLGMVLLQRHGILTGNIAERPGARVSLRLRPSADEVARFGGLDAVVGAIDDALDRAADLATDFDQARTAILGDGANIA